MQDQLLAAVAAARRKREEADWSLVAGGRGSVGAICFPILFLWFCPFVPLFGPLVFLVSSVIFLLVRSEMLGGSWRICLSTKVLYGKSLPTVDIKRLDWHYPVCEKYKGWFHVTLHNLLYFISSSIRLILGCLDMPLVTPQFKASSTVWDDGPGLWTVARGENFHGYYLELYTSCRLFVHDSMTTTCAHDEWCT